MRTERYKLIYYYGEALGAGGAIDRSTPPEWELFDLEKDPYGDAECLRRSRRMQRLLWNWRRN